jgi:hypothetical protein
LIIGKTELSVAILGFNPSGGFPSETVQFGFSYRIMVVAPGRAAVAF